jgi:hypothetical protein
MVFCTLWSKCLCRWRFTDESDFASGSGINHRVQTRAGEADTFQRPASQFIHFSNERYANASDLNIQLFLDDLEGNPKLQD